jgi:hypothetical protein
LINDDKILRDQIPRGAWARDAKRWITLNKILLKWHAYQNLSISKCCLPTIWPSCGGSAPTAPEIRRRLRAPGRARLRQRSPLPGAAFSKTRSSPRTGNTRAPRRRPADPGDGPSYNTTQASFPESRPNDAALDTVSGTANNSPTGEVLMLGRATLPSS